jgi:hypothetical protein
MLASVNIVAVGAGQISRPTCGLRLRLAYHLRSCKPACMMRGCRALCARHSLLSKSFACGAASGGVEKRAGGDEISELPLGDGASPLFTRFQLWHFVLPARESESNSSRSRSLSSTTASPVELSIPAKLRRPRAETYLL